ncbi:hypothetical protein [Roseateles sp.]|uniref:hypothetical protein n=1 Tax=Roseateles sp. TaxID=1971397 RepID=UPI002600FFC4|nr:hypothetical protein [Roseateles sp.]MBV8036117.1 hypothetical protein [Roseateles sp.]
MLLGWLFGIALVLTQQAAALHQLEHSLSDADATHQSDRAPRQACQLCQLFAHVESLAAGPGMVAMALFALSFAPPATVKPVRRSLDLPGLRNRGPPLLA